MNESLTHKSTRIIRRRPIARRVLLFILILVLLVGTVIQIAEAWTELNEHGMDLQQDYIAAQRLRQGRDIYEPFKFEEVAALGVRAELDVGMWENAHPPLTALLFVPLTYLSYKWAALSWTLLSVALLVFVSRRLIDILELPISGVWRWVLPFTLLVWYPVWQHLHVGQFTIVLFALLVGVLICLRQGSDWLAGLLIGFAGLLKMFPLVLLVYFLYRKRWRAVGSAMIVMWGLVFSQYLVGPDHWHNYVLVAAPRNAEEWVSNARNASIHGFSSRFFIGNAEVEPIVDIPSAELPARIIVLSFVCGWAFYLLRNRSRGQEVTGEYSLIVCLMLLLSPITWDHAFIFLLLPIAYVCGAAYRMDHYRQNTALAYMVIAIVLSVIPMELVHQRVLAEYYPTRIPGLYALINPGFLVLLAGFVSVALTLRNDRDVASRTRAAATHT